MSNMERATCTITSVPASFPRWRALEVLLPPSCRLAASRTSVARSAGTSPNSKAHTLPSSIVNPTTRQSSRPPTATSSAVTPTAGKSDEANDIANTRPIAAAIAERRNPSVRSCRVTREREAPMAVRTASSRTRARPRARSRFATFAQATRRTIPTTMRHRRQRLAHLVAILDLPSRAGFDGDARQVLRCLLRACRGDGLLEDEIRLRLHLLSPHAGPQSAHHQ